MNAMERDRRFMALSSLEGSNIDKEKSYQVGILAPIYLPRFIVNMAEVSSSELIILIHGALSIRIKNIRAA